MGIELITFNLRGEDNSGVILVVSNSGLVYNKGLKSECKIWI